MGATFVGAPHHAGPSLANDAPPCLPIEPVRTEDPDAFRRRMEEKASRQRLQMRAVTPEPKPEVDEGLQAAKFDTPPLEQSAPRPVPGPRPAGRPVVSAPGEAARLDVLESYERGESLLSLTKRLRVPEARVRGWLEAAGVPLRTRAQSVAAAKALKSGDQVRPCAGGCGRSTRPASVKVTEHPGTSPRVRDGLCGACANPDANRRQSTPTEQAEWVRLHVEEGRTLAEIAARASRSRWTISHALRAAGVQVRPGVEIHATRRAAGAPDAAPPPPAARKDPKVAARNAALVRVALEEPHVPVRLLAERFEVSEAVVYNVLSNAGVKRRTQRAASPAPTPSRPPAAPSAPAPLSTPPAPDVEPAPVAVPLPAVATTALPADLYGAVRAAVIDVSADLLDAAANLAAASGHLAALRTAVADLLTALPQEGPTP